jgi:hypothetical protein
MVEFYNMVEFYTMVDDETKKIQGEEKKGK